MLLKLPYLFQERYNVTRMRVELLRSLSEMIVKMMMHNRLDNAVNKFQLDNILLELLYLINYSIEAFH